MNDDDDWEEALLEDQRREDEEAMFDDFRRADREDALAWEEEAKMKGLTLEELLGECHAIGYGDIKTRPDYCKKLQQSAEEREACWCCSECCGCGG